MRHYLILLLLALCLAPQLCFSQSEEEELIDPILVYFKGQLIDKLTGEPVSYATVVNLRTRGGTTTDQNGMFTMEMLNVDTFMVSVIGYKKDRRSIELPYREGEVQQFLIESIRYPIGDVEVTGKKREYSFGDLGTGKVDSLSPEFRATTFEDKPKWWNAFVTPFAFIEYFQKGEKRRRELRKVLASEADWQRLSKYYNRDMVYELTGLEGEDADKFMIFFNATNQLTGNSNEYDVRAAIIKSYGEYMDFMSTEKEEE